MKPESAGTMPSRESEVAIVPTNLGKTEGREGPLLPSFVQCWERQPDCPRKGRLHPGPVEPRQRCPRDLNLPANFRGRYTEWPSNNRKGGLRFSTIRSVGRTSCKRPWRRVKSNHGAAGVDQVEIDEVLEYGEARFLGEIAQALRDGTTGPITPLWRR